MRAGFALAGIGHAVLAGHPRASAAQAHGGEAQFVAGVADQQRMLTQRFDALNLVVSIQPVSRPALRIRQGPGAIGTAPQQPVADIAVLQRAGVCARQAPVVRTLRHRLAIAKGRQRHAQQGQSAAAALTHPFAAPHALTFALLTQQHVQLALLVFQEGHLVDGHAHGLQAAGRSAIQRQAKHGRLCCRRHIRPRGVGAVEAARVGPHIDRSRRDIEHPPGRPQHRAGFTAHGRSAQVARRDGVQRQWLAGVEVVVAAVDARGRQDALKVQRSRAIRPFTPAQRRQHLRHRRPPGLQQRGAVEDQLAAYQAAGVVARRVVVETAQLVRGAVGQAAVIAQREEADFGATAGVAVADDDDIAARDQQLVVPGAARVAARGIGIQHRHGLQLVAAHTHREQAAAAQHHQMIAGTFDDAAFVNPGGLHVGDVVVTLGRDGRAAGGAVRHRGASHCGGRRRGRWRHRQGHGRCTPSLGLLLLRSGRPALQRTREFGFVSVRLQCVGVGCSAQQQAQGDDEVRQTKCGHWRLRCQRGCQPSTAQAAERGDCARQAVR